jgi:hypothetical protein
MVQIAGRRTLAALKLRLRCRRRGRMTPEFKDKLDWRQVRYPDLNAGHKA